MDAGQHTLYHKLKFTNDGSEGDEESVQDSNGDLDRGIPRHLLIHEA
jgi:hypothetical protein